MPDKNYSVEVDRVFVTLEADIAEYYKQVRKAVHDTKEAFKKVSPPKIAPSKQEQQQTESWLRNITQQLFGMKGASKQVATGMLQAFNSIKMFGRGQASAEAVAASIGNVGKMLTGLVSSANPATLAVVASLAAIGLAAKGVTDKVREATGELRTMLSGDIIAGSRYRLNPKLGVDTASEFERYATEFSVLLGSEEKARQRIAEYAEFGAKTPYNLPEIVRAGKLLQTMGKEALSTGDSLRMVGDVAAGTGRPFTELAMWIGRAYTAIQSGKPFGEAAMRLQELGVLSGTARNKMEQLQKSGASADEQWKFFTETMSKYNGMMEKLSGTLGGMQSNLEDFQEQVALAGGTPVFEEQKRHMEALIGSNGVFNKYEKQIKGSAKAIGELKAAGLEFKNLWSEAFLTNLPYDGIQKLLEGAAELAQKFNDAKRAAGGLKLPKSLADSIGVFAEGGAKILDIFNKFGDIAGVLSRWGDTLKPIGDTFGNIAKMLGTIIARTTNLAPAWEVLTKYIEDSGGVLNIINNAMTTLTQSIILAKGVLVAFIAGFQPAVKMVGELALAVQDAFERDFQGMQEHFDAAKNAVKDGLFDGEQASAAFKESVIADWEAVREKTEEATDAVRAYPEAVNTAAEEHAKRMEELEGITNKYLDSLYDARKQTDEQMEQLEKDHQDRQAKINDNAAKARKRADEQYQKALMQLNEEYTKQKQKLIEQSDKQKKRFDDEYRRSTERAEEDHLNRLRDLRRNYEASLDDAVKNRDARALADAQAAYEQQVQAENESYQQSKQRREEDYALQKQQMQEQLQEQLSALEEQTAQRRELLRQQNEEAWRQIQQSQIDQLNAENEGYAKRQQALRDALEKRLADIGDKFAKERKLTEDEARQVLSILNETFGIGGDIDKIMSDFVERTSAIASMEIIVKRNFSGTGYYGRGEQAASARYGAMASYYDKLRGGSIKLATGGLLLARQPTTLMVGEGGEPELVSVSPVSSLRNLQGRQTSDKITIEFTGSAPPGITEEDRDRIADVVASALLDTGLAHRISTQ